jgi:membrane protease YdiL (CAAX protease family)
METTNDINQIPQYTLGKILSVWALAAIPMGFLGWVVAPAIAQNPSKPGFERLAVLAIGLVWQFVLVMVLLYQETGFLRWATIRERLWLNPPRSVRSGEKNSRLWWWLIPLILMTTLFEMVLIGTVEKVWVALFPFFAEPAGFSLGSALSTPEWKTRIVGAWDIYALFIVQAIFNTFLGEELLFRGLLLPRMEGVFGKWDWVANGLLFGLYHLHQPWGVLGSAIEGIFLLALPSRRFRSSWFGIIVHSGQSIFFAFLLLGLVLGLA